MPHALFDFVDKRGVSVIKTWVDKELTKRSKGALEQKLDMLATSGMDLAPNLLAGPIKKTGHIYKLVIHADVMLRPMLCRGPFEMDREFTLLLGAIEKQSKLIPDPQDAIENRNTLVGNRQRRIPHEQY